MVAGGARPVPKSFREGSRVEAFEFLIATGGDVSSEKHGAFDLFKRYPEYLIGAGWRLYFYHYWMRRRG